MTKNKLLNILCMSVVLSASFVAIAQQKPEQFKGEGIIVAFQKYDRYREPIFHEAESCAGTVPITSKGGASHRSRPAGMEDFQRTKPGASAALPPLKDLPCLIVVEPPMLAANGSNPSQSISPKPTRR